MLSGPCIDKKFVSIAREYFCKDGQTDVWKQKHCKTYLECPGGCYSQNQCNPDSISENVVHPCTSLNAICYSVGL